MMSKAKALKEARSRWGSQAHIEYNGRAMTEPEKRPLRERLAQLRAEDKRETWREREALVGVLLTTRCKVGHLSWAYHVRGSGDTWEEAFEKADHA